ncbi:hypothetical protein CALCODRAFT_273335 [Calocera cornea HHB12733]|uniref:Uncharacterized protein n=1 Tax=Calocera cornea HHB12733 TaxID=1353952 RepID=A0A165G7C6_9BASI|nr:hypothetical protein CALCODRAFT_273335 [Calocera cornea HHB12733]
MSNYGAYTITLDGNQTSAFNASDLWWRHSETVLHFASGLDPSVSYSVAVANYDPKTPNPVAVGSLGYISASVGTLTLVMDDTESRDALIASLQTAASISASNSTASESSSHLPPGSIAAIVLGALLLLMLFLNGILVFQWQRMKKEMSSRIYTEATPWRQKESTAIPGQEHDSMAPDVTSAMHSVRQRRNVTRQHQQSLGHGPGDSGPSDGAPDVQGATIEPQSAAAEQDTQAHPEADRSGNHMLGYLVENLSHLLNGQLRQEYLQREGLTEPPEYVEG